MFPLLFYAYVNTRNFYYPTFPTVFQVPVGRNFTNHETNQRSNAGELNKGEGL
jgi:hypothetical protein